MCLTVGLYNQYHGNLTELTERNDGPSRHSTNRSQVHPGPPGQGFQPHSSLGLSAPTPALTHPGLYGSGGRNREGTMGSQRADVLCWEVVRATTSHPLAVLLAPFYNW